MAIPGKGILGGFAGKVGTVVGSTWKGISYMRSLPAVKKNRKVTEAQQLQQAKFALATAFFGGFTPLVNSSFKSTPKLTARNTALGIVLTQAIGGVYPNLFIDYSMVLVAKGSLKKADNPVVISPAAGKLRFNWTDNAGMGNAIALDMAILVAYSGDTNDVLFTLDGASRASGESQLDVPYFSGKLVHTWISFRSPDGKLTADSMYTGTVQVL